MHGQIDNNAYLTSPHVMPGEAAGRLATTASITIAPSLGDSLPMLIQDFQNWRYGRGQVDTLSNKLMRGTNLLPKCVGFVPLLLCATNKGGLAINNAR